MKLLILLALSALAHAANNHALLIGIGAYPSPHQLDGPPNDVASLQKLLLTNYHYRPDFIHVLLDKKATKVAIIRAMQDLINEVNPGDYVFFYYSGHGTSFYAPGPKSTENRDTAASLPVDFDISSPEVFGKTILFGTELRPFFKQLDEKAQVFAVFDSCYSQDAMKAITKDTSKYFQYGNFDATVKTCDATPQLPYQHLIAISAAKCNQTAADLDAKVLTIHPNATIDHIPHGQLTNAILQGLQGAADKNHDGVISHEELFNYVSELSATSWGHNPSLRLSAESSDALQQPAFAGKIEGLNNTCMHLPNRQPRIAAPRDLLVKLGEEFGKEFVPVTQDWDIKADPTERKFLLYDAGGIQLNESPMPLEKTVARLRAEPILEKLSELRYCRQSFNIRLDSDQPDQGKYLPGHSINLSVKLDQSAYVLVIDIDQEGGVTVMYRSPQKLPKGTTPLPQNKVLAPFGVDLIKAFAFASEPVGFDKFQPSPDPLQPGDPRLNALLAMVSTDAADRSETKLRLITGSY